MGCGRIFLELLLVCVALAERETLEYSMVEELGPHTRIGNIEHDAGIELKYDRDTLSQLTYRFLRAGDPGAAYFHVEEGNGALMTRTRIDRETICEPRAQQCVVEFDIAISPVPIIFLQVVGVRITIRDINDNAPFFPKPVIMLAISENVMPGATFVLPAAHDPDSGVLGIQQYEFVTTTTLFDLRQTTNNDGTTDLRLVLREKLDRELQTGYTMRVVARDGGVPVRSGSVTINVTVTDANDNSPVFDRASYEAQVEEDAIPGTVVLRVHATDPDQGPSGRVVYGLAQDTKTQYGHLFSINNRSGDVFLIGELDYEQEQTYNLLVTATDMGPGAVPTHARIAVRVRDVNDHSPVIVVNALTSSGQVEIPENAEPGHFVAHISIEDADGGRNGDVSCGISDDHFSIQKIYKNEYKIITADSFNREQSALYRLLLECQDHGDYPRRSTVDMYVRVLDVNDNPPVFSKEVYVVDFQENNTISDRILTVNASDRDVGANGRMTFRIAEDARTKVSVDSSSGVVRALDVFDYEKTHSFRFAVTVEDNGEPSFTSTATVLLNLMDINDQPPDFLQNSYTFATLENEPAGTTLGSVSATDPDSPPFDKVFYALRPSDTDYQHFHIDPQTGRISTKMSLDREHKERYLLNVVAGNPGYPRLTSAVRVIVDVADINDNAPMITYPSPQNHTLQISNRMPAGHVITRVQARDVDDGANSELTFSLAKGNEQGFFDIEEVSGVLTVAADLRQQDMQSFDLLVMASDNGDPQQTANADLFITINSSLPFKDSHALKATSPFGTAVANSTIVISLAAATVFLILILITALVCIKRKQHRGKRDEYRYMCQVDMAARRPPSAKDGADSDVPDAEPVPRPMPLPQPPPPVRSEPETARKEVRFNVLPDTRSRLDSNGSPGHWQGDMPQETQVPVHNLLQMALRDPNAPDSDSTSGCSADMSNTDSGRGPSEDGEAHLANHHGDPQHLPPPPYDMVKSARESNTEDIWERRVPGPPGADGGLTSRPGARPNQRNKVPMHRKAMSNNTAAAARPVAARTLPKKPPPHPYNTISAPHRLVDPREDPPAGILRRSASKDSVRPNQGQILSRSLCNLQDSPPVANNVQTKVANGPVNGPSNGSETLPLAPKVPPYPPPRTESSYCNTFGRNGPLSSLSRLEESRDESDSKAGNYPIAKPERKTVLTRMDTVV